MSPVRRRAPARRLTLVLAAAGSAAALAGCGSAVAVTGLPTPTPCGTPGPMSTQDSFSEHVALTTLSSGLQIGELRHGCGATVHSGQQVTVEYTGWLQNGTEFDSSRMSGRQPFVFPLGEGQVIPGFDSGVMNMTVGGKRRVVIPPALGYGAQGVPPVIPPNATLVFDVEVLAAQ